MKLLDLFCGAGGAAKGYQQAGFFVVGVDINPQPHYCGDAFIRGDAIEVMKILLSGGYVIDSHGFRWYLKDFDAIHASPPCQKYSLGSKRWGRNYPDLLNETERLLIASKLPFIIENVERAPFTIPTITLCGIQFGLKVIRHRKFGSNVFLMNVPHSISHPKRGKFVTCAGHGGNGSNSFGVWCDAMQIDWMTKKEIAEAIPPAYTKFIGEQLLHAQSG